MMRLCRMAMALGWCILINDLSRAAILEVSPVGPIQTIAESLVRALPGDTIRVQAGTYRESNLKIEKPVTIVGVSFPTVDAEAKGQIVEVSVSGVTITGLRFINTPVSYVKEPAAILLNNVTRCSILGNRFENNFFAVYAAHSNHCRVRGNEITGDATVLTAAGNGIHLWYCHDMDIEDNLVQGHRDGIYLEFVTASTISGNRSQHNLRYGLHFMYSDSCRYQRNAFVGNGAGVAVMYTHHVEMIDNDFRDSWGGASYGLLLKDIRYSIVTKNRFTGNSIGIHMEGSDHIEIDSNEFVANGWAIKMMANCLDCVVSDNDFVDNSFQVATNSRTVHATLQENYWSTYRGFDLDQDGFGDIPFRPVSLFSLMVESNPPTLVLLRSLLISALDIAERVFPTLTPEALLDPKPRMKRII